MDSQDQSRSERRCHASRAILDGGQQITFMYRVEPDDADSGWHFFSDGGVDQFTEEPDQTVVCELQNVRERDSTVSPLLDTRWPVAFARHSLTGEWVNCKCIRTGANNVFAAATIGILAICILWGMISGLGELPPHRWFITAQTLIFGGYSTAITWLATMLTMLVVFMAALILVMIPIQGVTGRRGFAWPSYVIDKSNITLDADALGVDRNQEPVSDQVIKSATGAGVAVLFGLTLTIYGLLKLTNGGKASDAWFIICLGTAGLIVGLALAVFAWHKYRREARRR